MFKFFFDTANAQYVRETWAKIKDYVPAEYVVGITTNPNAMHKENARSMGDYRTLTRDLCETVSAIRGDDKGVVYVQPPNSRMTAEEIIQWLKLMLPYSDGVTRLGLKIPPYPATLAAVDQLRELADVNVTGVADCSTALLAFTYGVRYVSIIPGRMEEKGIDAWKHVAYAQQRKADGSEIITGSMRTLAGLEWVVQYGTVPTIGTRVWDQIVQDEATIKSVFAATPTSGLKLSFSPLIQAEQTELSIDFFKQMDELGAKAYEDFKGNHDWLLG